MQTILSDLGMADQMIEVMSVKIMELMDQNGDGKVDEAEWCAAYPAFLKLQQQLEEKA